MNPARQGAAKGSTRLTVLLVPLLVVTGACPKRDKDARRPRLAVHGVKVRDRTPPAERIPSLSEDQVERRARNRLKKSGQVALVKEKKKGTYLVTIELGSRGSTAAAALVIARASPTEYGGLVLQASTLSALTRDKPTPAQRRAHLLAAVDRVVDDIAFQARLARAPAAEVVAALDPETDPARLAAAIEIAAVRRTKEAVPRLIGLLNHGEGHVSDRAIGALVSIGDRRAVKHLTRMAKFTDTARLAKVIDGIAALGGKEARAYLEFVAVGHADADIRSLATEALQRMDRTAGAADGGT